MERVTVIRVTRVTNIQICLLEPSVQVGLNLLIFKENAQFRHCVNFLRGLTDLSDSDLGAQTPSPPCFDIKANIEALTDTAILIVTLVVTLG